jgi:hypothetical protein
MVIIPDEKSSQPESAGDATTLPLALQQAGPMSSCDSTVAADKLNQSL